MARTLLLFCAMMQQVSLLGLTALMGCAMEVGGPELEPVNTPMPRYDILAIQGSPTPTPAALQPDFNIKLRGMGQVLEALELVDANVPGNLHAPKIDSIYADGRVPAMLRLYRVGKAGGLATGLEGGDPVHVAELTAVPGEPVSAPQSGHDIGEGMSALVLYADTDSLTLQYSRVDSVLQDHTVHLIGLDVDEELIELYKSCVKAGRRELPALFGGQTVGSAASTLMVSVRDQGRFTDPRWRRFYNQSQGAQ